MTRTLWGILALALVAAACTSTSAESTTTSAIEEPTTTTSASDVIVLVGESDPGQLTDFEAERCVTVFSRVQRAYDWLLANVDPAVVPRSASVSDVARWSRDNADLSREVCRALGWDSAFIFGPSRSRRLMEVQAELLLSEAVDWSNEDFEFRMLGAEGLDDPAIVWCASNPASVLSAADVLGVGADVSPELDIEATITDTYSGSSASWSVRDVTSAADQNSIWTRYHIDLVAR